MDLAYVAQDLLKVWSLKCKNVLSLDMIGSSDLVMCLIFHKNGLKKFFSLGKRHCIKVSSLVYRWSLVLIMWRLFLNTVDVVCIPVVVGEAGITKQLESRTTSLSLLSIALQNSVSCSLDPSMSG